MKAQKNKKLKISFAHNSRKKTALIYREGGRFISRKKYLESSGLSESQLNFAEQNIINPATNKTGNLAKKDRESVAELFNKFISAKKNIPQKYSLKINITSLKSISSISGKDIFLFYKGTEYKLTYNDFLYFCARFLENIQAKTIYIAVNAEIDEENQTVKIVL